MKKKTGVCIYYREPSAEEGKRKGSTMDINNKMIMDLASQLGLDSKNSKQTEKAADLAEKYKGKSDQELISEILKLKQSMKKDKAQYEKQLRAIKSLKVMMNDEQKARLDKVIRLLESDD